MFRTVALTTLFALFAMPSRAAIIKENTVFLLPLECSELLPDSGPYLKFMEAIARGNLRKDKNLSKRVFKILATREKMQQSIDESHETNPVDILIRKTLCFYREKKEPLKMVPYDDPQFLAFLHGSIGDLEKKVEESIFQREYDKHQRKEYERQLGENQDLEDTIRSQAEVDADRNFDRLSKAAKRKVRVK